MNAPALQETLRKLVAAPYWRIMTFARGCAALVLALLTVSSSDALNLRMEASTAWVENINRASAGPDWREAFRHEARASLSLLRQWSPGFVTTGEMGAGYERVPQYARLEAFTAGGTIQARQKFGFGAMAPFIVLNGGLRGRAAQLDGDDGWTATGELRLGKRLTHAWRVAGVGDWQQHYARNSIFDTRHHRLFGIVTWDITDRLQFSHGNGRLWGDFTANASPAVWPRALSGALGSNISAYYNTISWGVTDSYGPGWVTYRVTGRVSFWWLELSPAIGRNTSLPFRYDSLFSVNKVGVKYRQDIWSVQLLHRF